MTKYLISFPSEAMVVSAEELPSVAAAARAVIEEAKAAGVYVFGGGIAEEVDPVRSGELTGRRAQVTPATATADCRRGP
ncbi:hypothetical protein [Phenylobacterium sp.]|uniref:hypothetical protein n=1 Tax=Phenylobacterium sp. TaxID=1871053 RepID=UPI0035B0E606